MKTRLQNRFLILAFMAGLSSLAAQSYRLDWHTMDSGAVTSSSTSYSVSATIGQPDVGGFFSRSYTLAGGFWSAWAAFQRPPTLAIERGPANSVIISWPAPSAGWQLREKSTLEPGGDWDDVSISPVQVDGRMQITVTPLVEAKFYRLEHP